MTSVLKWTDRKFSAAVCLAIAAVVLAIYAPVVQCGFLDLDDDAYVTNNPHVLAGLTRESLS